MRRFAKIILVAVGGALALLLIALVGVNLYLQSGDVQQRIRTATAQALGTPIVVKRTAWTPWSGLALSGLSLPDPRLPGSDLMDASEFSMQFKLLPLFSHHFVISEVTLAAPKLVLRQQHNKKWELLPPKPVPPPATKLPGIVTTTPSSSEPVVHAPAYTLELQQFHIHDGGAEVIDRKGAYVARVGGLSVDGEVHNDPSSGERTISGDVWIENIEIAGMIYPNRLRAHFERKGDQLIISSIKCALAGGRLRAECYIITPHKEKPVFQIKGQLEEISIPTLLQEASGDAAGAKGTLAGAFNLHGNPTDASTLAGSGNILLDSAQLRPLDFLQQIGMLLRIDELQMLNLREATMHFSVHDSRFWLDDLTLKTENLIINGKGPIRFDGKMDLKGRLLVDQKLQQQLGGLLGNNFVLSDDPDYKQVSFSVTGRVDKPKTDLVEKVTGLQFHNVGGFLKGLFQIPKQPDDDNPPLAPAPAQDGTSTGN